MQGTENASRTQTRWALGSLALSMLMPSLDVSICNSGLPTLTRQLGASFTAAQWIVLAYLLSITTLIVSAGRLGDLLGRRRLLLAGISLFTMASLACGLAPSLPVLLAARAAQGLGAALMLALTMASVADAVPTARTGSAMGLLGTLSAVGTMLGPVLGGVLMSHYGWRAIFLVNIPLGLINFGLVRRHLPASPARGGTRFDHLGTLLLITTLGAYALAMTLGHGHFAVLNAVLLVLALAGGTSFVMVEKRATSPLIRPALLRDPVLGSGLALSTLVSTVIMSTMVVGPFYLAQGLGLPLPRVGLVLAVGPLVSALTGVPAGRLVDHAGARRVVLLGLGLMATGCTALALLPLWVGAVGYLGSIAVLTCGYALLQAANNTAIMQTAGAAQRGLISGMLSLSRYLGLISGAAVMGAVFAAAVGTPDLAHASPAALAHGLHGSFALAAGLILLALGLGFVFTPAPEVGQKSAA